MARGRKTGGRTKGTPNKRTQARRLGVDELLAKYRYDPLEAMIREASDDTVEPEVRRWLHGQIIGYVYPKLKSVEAKIEPDLPPGLGLTGEALRARVLSLLRDEDLIDEMKRRGGLALAENSVDDIR